MRVEPRSRRREVQRIARLEPVGSLAHGGGDRATGGAGPAHAGIGAQYLGRGDRLGRQVSGAQSVVVVGAVEFVVVVAVLGRTRAAHLDQTGGLVVVFHLGAQQRDAFRTTPGRQLVDHAHAVVVGELRRAHVDRYHFRVGGSSGHPDRTEVGGVHRAGRCSGGAGERRHDGLHVCTYGDGAGADGMAILRHGDGVLAGIEAAHVVAPIAVRMQLAVVAGGRVGYLERDVAAARLPAVQAAGDRLRLDDVRTQRNQQAHRQHGSPEPACRATCAGVASGLFVHDSSQPPRALAIDRTTILHFSVH